MALGTGSSWDGTCPGKGGVTRLSELPVGSAACPQQHPMKKLLLQPWLQLAHPGPQIQAGLGSHSLALGWPGAPLEAGSEVSG